MGPAGTRSFLFLQVDGRSAASPSFSPRRGAGRAASDRGLGTGSTSRTDRRAGSSRPRAEARANENLCSGRGDGANHGGAARRRHDDRRLRTRQRRPVASIRRGRDHVASLASGDFISGHRPPACTRIGFRARGRSRGANSRWRRGSTAASASAAGSRQWTPGRTDRRRVFSLSPTTRARVRVELSIRAMSEARLILTEDLVRAALRREKAALKEARRSGSRRPGAELTASPAPKSRRKAAARGSAAGPLGPDEGDPNGR